MSSQKIFTVVKTVKKYINENAFGKNAFGVVKGFNTSQFIFPILNDHLETIIKMAIEKAKSEGLITVLDRHVIDSINEWRIVTYVREQKNDLTEAPQATNINNRGAM